MTTATDIVVTVRPIDQWPEGWLDPHRAGTRLTSPFRVTSYQATLDKLTTELRFLDATAAHLQLDVEPGQVRRDGWLRTGARVRHPGVILTADTPTQGSLVLACDRFDDVGYRSLPAWQSNLRAVALSLESLRRVDRYGVTSGRQYAGFRALPEAAGTALGAGETATMSPDEAIEFIAAWSSHTADEIRLNPMTSRRSAIRRAMLRLHPDSGADHTPARWASFQSARATLEGT